jgi:hypothetical protein
MLLQRSAAFSFENILAHFGSQMPEYEASMGGFMRACDRDSAFLSEISSVEKKEQRKILPQEMLEKTN